MSSLRRRLDREPDNDLGEAFLRDISFRRLSISGANLAQSDLRNADFSEVPIRNIDFTGADLTGANFSGVDIPPAVSPTGPVEEQFFVGASLNEVDFSGAYLQGIDLSRVDGLSESNFSDCNLNGANLSGVTAQNTDFSESNLGGANFTNASLRYSDFTDTRAFHAVFRGADLYQTRLVRTDLVGADLRETDLFEAYFTNTRIQTSTKFGEQLLYESKYKQATSESNQLRALKKSAWVYNALISVAKENNMSNSARVFYRNRQSNRHRISKLSGDLVSRLYYSGSRHLTIYGDSPSRIVLSSFLVILCFAIFYPLIGGVKRTEAESPIIYSLTGDFRPHLILDVLYFSAATFSSLSYGTIQPVGTGGEMIAVAESLLGGILMALLVFVLGRRATW